MNNLTAKQYTLIRNIIMFAGIILAFLLWLYIPSVIENNPLIHVGNGTYGSKLGFLLLLLIPFFGLIPKNPYEEVHTADTEERVKIENEQKIESEKYQITITIACSLIACFCMILGIILG